MKRSRLRPVSKRREREIAERRVMLEENFGPRDTWQCWVSHRPAMALIMGGCYGAVNGHEIVKRSQWRDGILEPKNILMLCNLHNEFVEREPDIAHKFGLMKHRWENE